METVDWRGRHRLLRTRGHRDRRGTSTPPRTPKTSATPCPLRPSPPPSAAATRPQWPTSTKANAVAGLVVLVQN